MDLRELCNAIEMPKEVTDRVLDQSDEIGRAHV